MSDAAAAISSRRSSIAGSGFSRFRIFGSLLVTSNLKRRLLILGIVQRIRSVKVVGRQPLCPRIGPQPHEQADPLEVLVLTGLTQGHVRLQLQGIREVRTRTLAVEKDPECGLDARFERARERCVRDRVGTVLEE